MFIIFVSQKLHIAHPRSWTHSQTGKNPTPFTLITHKEVADGTWVPGVHLAYADLEKVFRILREGGSQARAELQRMSKEWCLRYTQELEKSGKFKLCIWPEHCLVGTRGHAVVPAINKAIQKWAETTKRKVTYVLKGQNLRTEMYSALKAEVIDPEDECRTDMNDRLLNSLKCSDKVRNIGCYECQNCMRKFIITISTRSTLIHTTLAAHKRTHTRTHFRRLLFAVRPSATVSTTRCEISQPTSWTSPSCTF
jgi:nicotinamidase-related amidase